MDEYKCENCKEQMLLLDEEDWILWCPNCGALAGIIGQVFVTKIPEKSKPDLDKNKK